MALPGFASSGFQVSSRSSSSSKDRQATLSAIMAASTLCSADRAPASSALSLADQPSSARRSAARAASDRLASLMSNLWSPRRVAATGFLSARSSRYSLASLANSRSASPPMADHLHFIGIPHHGNE